MAQKRNRLKLVREAQSDEVYEYYPLGEYVVVAPGVCGGRPTFKGTRLEAQVILDLLAAGETPRSLVRSYRHSRLTLKAIQEAVRLAAQAFADCYTNGQRGYEG
jgi:uncharacterized protein (DUF433 family)